MVTFKKGIALCVATTLLSSSFALAATKKEELMNMGPNQIIREGKNFLWENSYRVDKELVGYTESHSEQNYSNQTINTESSVSGGMNPVKMVSGAVVGGLLGGFMAPAFGIGTAVAALGSGALSAGLLSGDPKSKSNRSDSMETNVTTTQDVSSRTYQIHNKANTWALIAIDKAGYLKARQEITDSKTLTGNKSCVKQGMQFLDSVLSNYKTADTKDLETFSQMITELNKRSLQEAIVADSRGGVSVINEKIDEFSEQRIRIVRISWKDVLNRSSYCNDLSNDLKRQTTALYNDILKTSLIVEVNSVAQIPLALNLEVQSRPVSEGNMGILKASQLRMAVNYVRTMKSLNDSGVVELTRVKSKDKKSGTAKIVIKDMQKFVALTQAKVSLDSLGGNTGLIASAAPAGLLVLSGINSVGAVGERAIGAGSLAVGTASLLTSAVAVYKNDQSEKEKSKVLQQMLVQVQKDASLNRDLDNMIAQTNRLFALENVSADLITAYKSQVASGLVAQAIKAQGKDINVKNGVNYVSFLRDQNVISQQEINDVAIILEVMKEDTMVVRNADIVTLGLNQAKTMLATTKNLLDTTKDSAQREPLLKLQKSLENEVRILSLLK